VPRSDRVPDSLEGGRDASCSRLPDSAARDGCDGAPLVGRLGGGAQGCGCLWAGGFLTGKYTRDLLNAGRLGVVQNSGNPVFERIPRNDRNWEIEGVLRRVAQEIGRPAAQVALNWITKRPGVSAVLVGAKSVDQLHSNLQALDFELPAELASQLEAASRPESVTDVRERPDRSGGRWGEGRCVR